MAWRGVNDYCSTLVGTIEILINFTFWYFRWLVDVSIAYSNGMQCELYSRSAVFSVVGMFCHKVSQRLQRWEAPSGCQCLAANKYLFFTKPSYHTSREVGRLATDPCAWVVLWVREKKAILSNQTLTNCWRNTPMSTAEPNGITRVTVVGRFQTILGYTWST